MEHMPDGLTIATASLHMHAAINWMQHYTLPGGSPARKGHSQIHGYVALLNTTLLPQLTLSCLSIYENVLAECSTPCLRPHHRKRMDDSAEY